MTVAAMGAVLCSLWSSELAGKGTEMAFLAYVNLEKKAYDVVFENKQKLPFGSEQGSPRMLFKVFTAKPYVSRLI